MRTNAYLNFDGQCEAAFKFYEKVLGSKIEGMMPHEGTPAAEHVPVECRGKILHARMTVGDTVLMASDAPPGRYEKPAGISVALQVDDPAEGERIFSALAENGSVTMPYGATFWSTGFGMCTDQYGIPWMVNCESAN